MTGNEEGSGVHEENDEPALSWLAAIAQELRSHAVPYAVLLAFVVAGPIVTHWVFPEAPRGAGLFGGIAFGAYAALCAMPGRFL
jgi:hypothetical protein